MRYSVGFLCLALKHLCFQVILSSRILQVKLTSPKGTVSTVLPPRNSDSTSAGFSQWPFMSVHFWGEDPAGNWKFEVINGGQSGKKVNPFIGPLI